MLSRSIPCSVITVLFKKKSVLYFGCYCLTKSVLINNQLAILHYSNYLFSSLTIIHNNNKKKLRKHIVYSSMHSSYKTHAHAIPWLLVIPVVRGSL